MARPSRVALALGSGGARGYAHIGVIAELEARGFEIVTVAGSSMGALVGGLYCAGKLDDYVDWISGLSQLDVVRLLDVSLTKPGVIGAERILLRELKDQGLGKAKVEGLPHCDWVLIDAGDVIVHLFRPEVRTFYNIEKIWAVDSAHRMVRD
mgnify:CR=1 FL=1